MGSVGHIPTHYTEIPVEKKDFENFIKMNHKQHQPSYLYRLRGRCSLTMVEHLRCCYAQASVVCVYAVAMAAESYCLLALLACIAFILSKCRVEAIPHVPNYHWCRSRTEYSNPITERKLFHSSTCLILAVVICSKKRLSHACLKTTDFSVNLRKAHQISYNLLVRCLDAYQW